jgi:hypothetical protein
MIFQVDHVAGNYKEVPTSFSQRRPGRRAQEEPFACPVFYLFDLQTQGGLGHAQSLGSLTEIACLGDCNK